PLLFETGYADLVDKSIVVTASQEQRIARVVRRDRAGEELIRARIAAQIDPEVARARADYVIENDGDLERLRERTKAVYEAILR
ncbi:MAG: dephospho-CoA kinase, partial [Vulcanimicrobiaceae bacterium]